MKSGPWTSAEIGHLRRLASLGAETAAEVLGRSVTSVKWQAHRQGISLRRGGELRGLVLGQPRNRSAARDEVIARLRAELAGGSLRGADLERLNRRIRLLATGRPLCPACGVRPQEVDWTGLCEDCHLRELADKLRLAPERREAEREWDRERQRKRRRKKQAPRGRRKR